ncbi:helix-turn-helix domain-containing protein [Paramicrobacterium sp. CJ85]
MQLREAGWSNKAIADELQVHPSTVGRWFTPPVEEPETTTGMETTP